jgi:hypothetical protein
VITDRTRKLCEDLARKLATWGPEEKTALLIRVGIGVFGFGVVRVGWAS